MDEATSVEAVSAFVEELLAGSGWQLDRVRQRSSRLDPPNYWSLFEVRINKDGETRSLRMVAAGAFTEDAWRRLQQRLERNIAGRGCDPINGVGYPRLFPESQHAYWFYPFDPAMPNLPTAADPSAMATVLLGLDPEAATAFAATGRLEIERVRYVPEVGAILRYTIDTGAGPITIYGKVQPGDRGLRTHQIVGGLWQAAKQYDYEGLIYLPRPLGFVEELGLLLEEAIPGKPVGGNRMSVEFGLTAEAAAEAAAVIHESLVPADGQVFRIEAELGRLDRVTQQFIQVHPKAAYLLSDLVAHMRDHVRATEEEDWLPTHGDLKYDQFIHHNGKLTLLDFDYFALAETSYDLGKFCAYLVPSIPRDWEETLAAEEMRVRFLRRYRELRPYATVERFAIYEALQLALRAMSFMWAQVPGWERMAETFLVLAFERLKSRFPDSISPSAVG
jgi:Phosphotransferase enzyme family